MGYQQAPLPVDGPSAATEPMSETTPHLTVSRRFAFSSSIRLSRDGWSREVNERTYGPSSRARWGFGVNPVAHLVFAGPVDPVTGMMVNLADVKRRVGAVIDSRYDHRFLNVDTPPFGAVMPTAENVAVRLLEEVKTAFADGAVHPVACHLLEAPGAGAVAWSDGRAERFAVVEFSAARRTFSPHLSEEENARLFGIAARPGGHGHNYRLRVTFAGPIDPASGLVVPFGEREAALGALVDELDHTNLNADVSWLEGRPVTTESLAREAWRRLRRTLPVDRVRLWELPGFSAEYGGGDAAAITWRTGFHAAHRLHAPELSEDENSRTYGKCNNPAGHGHRYVTESSVAGAVDERSGTVADLGAVAAAVDEVVEPWRWIHLDREMPEFASRPSSSENIVGVLWQRLSAALPELVRLRLWETENNRFTMRRTAEEVP